MTAQDLIDIASGPAGSRDRGIRAATLVADLLDLLVEAVAEWRVRRRQIRLAAALGGLGDHLLRDIGLTQDGLRIPRQRG